MVLSNSEMKEQISQGEATVKVRDLAPCTCGRMRLLESLYSPLFEHPNCCKLNCPNNIGILDMLHFHGVFNDSPDEIISFIRRYVRKIEPEQKRPRNEKKNRSLTYQYYLYNQIAQFI